MTELQAIKINDSYYLYKWLRAVLALHSICCGYDQAYVRWVDDVKIVMKKPKGKVRSEKVDVWIYVMTHIRFSIGQYVLSLAVCLMVNSDPAHKANCLGFESQNILYQIILELLMLIKLFLWFYCLLIKK